MPSPEPYFDDDPPPRDSPLLIGVRLHGLARFRATADCRVSRSPYLADAHMFHRNLMIALAVKAGMTHEAVAGAMNLSRARVTNILKEMETLASKGEDVA